MNSESGHLICSAAASDRALTTIPKDCVLQPRVARNELPWEKRAEIVSTLKGLRLCPLRNDYRLIVAAHFNRQSVYTLRFMTHAEYSTDRWKDTL